METYTEKINLTPIINWCNMFYMNGEKVNKCKCGSKAKVTGSLVECSSKSCSRCVQCKSKDESIMKWNEINPKKDNLT